MSGFCFWQHDNGTISESTQRPCGPVNDTNPNLNCCVPGDTCLPDGICAYSHSILGGSGFYTGGCVSEDFSSPCVNRCGDQRVPDIVYNATADLWNCCGYDDNLEVRTCSDPTEDTFRAPAPAKLAPYYTVYSSGQTPPSTEKSSSSLAKSTNDAAASSTVATTAMSASASSARSSRSAIQTSTPSNASSAGLSTAAKAGIGVGSAIGVILFIGAIITIIALWRRSNFLGKSPARNTRNGGLMYEEQLGSGNVAGHKVSTWKAELDAGREKDHAVEAPVLRPEGPGVHYELGA